MTAFTARHDPDDVSCRDLTSRISFLGILCLIVMERIYPAQISADRLAYRFKVGDKRKTLAPVLDELWTYGYASHTGAEHWRITDTGRQAVAFLVASTAASHALPPASAQPAQPTTDQIVDNSPNSVDKSAGENLRPDLSIDQSLIDQSIDRIDRSNIDLKKEQTEKIAWLNLHSVSGDKRTAALASADCTAQLLQAWLDHWTRTGKTAKGEPFRNKYGPLNYALTCAINGDTPPLQMGEGRPKVPDASTGCEGDSPLHISEPEKPAAPSVIDTRPIFKPLE